MRKLIALAFLATLAFPGNLLAADDSSEVMAKLKEYYPRYQANKIEKSPVEGLYMVHGQRNILYFAPATGHLIVGDMFSSKGTNLTEAARMAVSQKQLAELPLDLAVKIGNGPKQVVEVTDPDCPFCRKGSQFFSEREDVTRYVFFYPLKNHPNAEKKADYILSSKNQAQAYEEIMSGKFDKVPLPEFESTDRLSKHKEVVAGLGVRGTPAYWANGTFVSGANTAKLNQALQ